MAHRRSAKKQDATDTRPNIFNVASAARVSVATVSRVLNGVDSVSPKLAS